MLRFSIRDLLWLMVVVGLSVALFISHQNGRAMEGQLKDMKRLRAENHAFYLELRRVSEVGGKWLAGWEASPDGSWPYGYTFTFQYKDYKDVFPALPKPSSTDTAEISN